VECKPRRLTTVERAVRGRSLGQDAADAADGLASQGARPLNHNHYKMPLMDNLVKRALLA
jgi:xanthine dehydrogenase YagS FAD-binding subunit